MPDEKSCAVGEHRSQEPAKVEQRRRRQRLVVVVVVVVLVIVIAPAIPGYFGPEIRNKASTFSAARKIRRTATGAAELNVPTANAVRPNP